MSKKVLTLMAIVLVFSACQVQADVIHSTWVGGEEGRWTIPDNWEPNIVPDNDGNSFVVTIDSNTLVIDRIKISEYYGLTLDQLFCDGNVLLKFFTSSSRIPTSWSGPGIILEHTEGLVNYGNLEISSDPFIRLEIRGNILNSLNAYFKLRNAKVTGDISNYGEAAIYDSYVTGNLTNFPNSVVNTENKVEFDGDIENEGLILVYPPAGEILTKSQLHNTGTIKLFDTMCVSNGNLFNNDTAGKITGYGLIGAQLFVNKGTIYSQGGSLSLFIEDQLSNSGLIGNTALTSLNVMNLSSHVDVNNSGTIKANTGGGVAFDYNLVNEPNGIIKLLGGTLAATTITQTADANFAGFGGITGDVVIESNAIIKLTGPTNVVGDVEIGTSATLEISDGTTLITGHTTCNNGTIHMIGGRIICQGGLTNNNCNIIWEPGTYTNIADFNLDGQVNFKDFAYLGDTWLWQADWFVP